MDDVLFSLDLLRFINIDINVRYKLYLFMGWNMIKSFMSMIHAYTLIEDYTC